MESSLFFLLMIKNYYNNASSPEGEKVPGGEVGVKTPGLFCFTQQ